MILSSLPVESEARTKEPFHLFKPLLLIAVGVFFFELLPIDFQHLIAPQLVSYEEVYKSDNRRTDLLFDAEGSLSVNRVSVEGFSLNPAEQTSRN